MAQRRALGDRATAELCRELASATPAPGGGAAAALVGALGAALGNMAGNVTLRHCTEEQRVQLEGLNARAAEIREKLLLCMDEDTAAYAALSEVLKLPRGEVRLSQREEKLCGAADTPLKIMALCAESVEVLECYERLSSDSLLSDVATQAALLRGALLGGAVNVRANTRNMKNTAVAARYEAAAMKILEDALPRVETVFWDIYKKIR